MKGFAILGLALALQSAFLFSIATTPSRDEAAAQLWPNRSPAAAGSSAAPGAAPQDDEPRFVDVEEPIVVVVHE
jgi:hypothetical protein